MASSWLPSVRAGAAFLLGSLPASLLGLWLATPRLPGGVGGEHGLAWRIALTAATAVLLCGAPALLYGTLAQLWRHRARIESAPLFWASALPGFLLHATVWALRSARLDEAVLALVLGLGAAIAADLLPLFFPHHAPAPSPRRRGDEAAAFGVVGGYGLLTVLALHQLWEALGSEGLEGMAGFASSALLLGLPSFLVIGAAFAAGLGLLFFAGDLLGSLLRPGAAPPVPYGLISATLCLLLAWDLWPGVEHFIAQGWLALLLPFLSGLLGTLLAPRRAS